MIYFKLPFQPPEGSAGCANACFIRIKKGYENDAGLLHHEICHVGQWWKTLGIHSIFYPCSKAYRLIAEVEAYKVQLQHPHPKYTVDELRDMYAGFIANDYKLAITKEEAARMLI